ncbi:MAG: hypothetical protein LBM67_02360 [Lentimicrobiaceae bacterium]|jgi:uncharacterized protein YfaP (DUF2135 family)|nr:hypothetical protein [Lentimicrobiaceae bacterium]
MKRSKHLLTLAMSLTMAFAFIFVGCKKDKDDDNSNNNKIEANYFAIQGASFVDSNFPSPNSDITLDNVNINANALPGGSLPVSINFDGNISKIYVGVEGVNGHYEVTPSTAKKTANSYPLMINVSQNLTESFTIQISILTEDGLTTQVFEKTINYIEAGTGALQISLAFDNEKDVDLYVVRPDSLVIYYGNKGPGDYDEEGNYVRVWGLDIDSNAGCGIDGINNENVFFPKGYVMSGTYQVWVNMYSNCAPQERETIWTISTTYQGSFIGVSSGENPAAGVFAIDEPSNSIGGYLNENAIKVMEFEIVNGDDSLLETYKTTFPLDASAKQKLENIF